MIRRSSLAAIVLLSAVCGILSGCGGYGPEQTVEVEIYGVDGAAERTAVVNKLTEMTDGSGHSAKSRWGNAKLIVTLAPVADPQAFAEKVKFAKILSVRGRTVSLIIEKAPPIPQRTDTDIPNRPPGDSRETQPD